MSRRWIRILWANSKWKLPLVKCWNGFEVFHCLRPSAQFSSSSIYLKWKSYEKIKKSFVRKEQQKQKTKYKVGNSVSLQYFLMECDAKRLKVLLSFFCILLLFDFIANTIGLKYVSLRLFIKTQLGRRISS